MPMYVPSTLTSPLVNVGGEGGYALLSNAMIFCNQNKKRLRDDMSTWEGWVGVSCCQGNSTTPINNSVIHHMTVSVH